MKGKKVVSFVLAAALAAGLLVIPSNDTIAAKKAALSKKSVTISVDGTATIKVKNANKKAKVAWKVASRKVAKITKKVTKGKKASATVKGVAAGSTKLTATYKVGKKKSKLTCKIVVNAASVADGKGMATTAPNGTTAPNVTATKAPEGSAAPTAGTATDKPAAATKTPKPTPKPTATPVPNPDAEIFKTYVAIEADGTDEQAWDFVDWVQIDNWAAEEGKARQTGDAAAKILWDDNNVYVLVNVVDPDVSGDSVDIYFDQYDMKVDYATAKALVYNQPADPSKKGAAAESSKWDGGEVKSAVKATSNGYQAEFVIPLDKEKGPKEGNFFGLEIQINDFAAGTKNGIVTLFSNPAKPDADDAPAKSVNVFGDCRYAVKRVTKVIELDLTNAELRNMEKPAQFVDKDGYETMNTECSFDDVNGKIICKSANNVFLMFPEGRWVLNTEKAKVEITGTYSGENGFRVWLCDTRSGVSDEAATSSDQVTFSPSDLNTGGDDNRFTVTAELTSGPTSSASWSEKFPDVEHDGNSNALMIKAHSWDAMLDDLVIESVVITVEDPVLNTP